MNRLRGIMAGAALAAVLAGCASAGNTARTEAHDEVEFNGNILFSINHGAPGFGTRAECADAEIVVHTDRSVRILMEEPGFETVGEIGTVTLSKEDYEKLDKLIDREQFCNIQVEDGDALDGSSSHITLYDENDETFASKGGYMPVGDEYQQLYADIKEILRQYPIDEIVEAQRALLE